MTQKLLQHHPNIIPKSLLDDAWYMLDDDWLWSWMMMVMMMMVMMGDDYGRWMDPSHGVRGQRS